MNKKEASEILGVSEKTLGNYVRSGRLNVRYEKGATSKVAVYDEAEIRALKLEIEDPTLPANGKGGKVVTPVIVNVESQETVNPVNMEIPGNTGNVATLAKVETSFPPLPDGVGQLAEFAVLVGNHIADGITESLSKQQLATQPLLTFGEAAAYSRIPEKMLREAVKNNEIPARKIGRGSKVRRVDVDAWIEKLYQ